MPLSSPSFSVKSSPAYRPMNEPLGIFCLPAKTPIGQVLNNTKRRHLETYPILYSSSSECLQHIADHAEQPSSRINLQYLEGSDVDVLCCDSRLGNRKGHCTQISEIPVV